MNKKRIKILNTKKTKTNTGTTYRKKTETDRQKELKKYEKRTAREQK